MMDEPASGEPPELFLANLGEALRKKEGVDGGLAKILQKHILTANPTRDAVALAKSAILQLAGERAALPKEEAANG